MQADVPEPSNSRSLTFGGVASVVITIVALALLTPLSGAMRPILLIVVFALAVYSYFRLGYYFGRVVGRFATVLFLIAAIVFCYTHYTRQLQIDELAHSLKRYDTAKIRQDLTSLPFPYVEQLSVSDRVSDEQLFEMLRFPELQHIKYLYLKSKHLTDATINRVTEIQKLEYIYIDCPLITEDAVDLFRRRHPETSVIIPFKG